ncbi:V4R domain-containing protein [Paenibacillus sp. GCM10012306]|uniref:V4R domain-containing protein n=1 Tax=Paenibacillus sp. GCM10012306 TaxID=3317342 RepID=UPI00360DB5C6
MLQYSFEDMKRMDRAQLGNMVPLELFRTIRLIGLNQGLPMGGKDDCFCKGLPVQEEKMICDLEGAILEGAISKIMGRIIPVREIKCDAPGHKHCEYEIRL